MSRNVLRLKVRRFDYGILSYTSSSFPEDAELVPLAVIGEHSLSTRFTLFRRSRFMKRFLLPVLAPVLLFGVVEVLLAIAGVGTSKTFYIREERSGIDSYVASKNSPWGPLPFRPIDFPVEKGPKTFRVFCLGASSVKGTPFGEFSGFAEWTKVRLEHLHPDYHFEVVRMGFDAKAAKDIADVCEEVVDFNPDLIVVYTGHNEYLQPNLPSVKEPFLTECHDLAMSLRLVRWVAGQKPRSDSIAGWMKNPVREISDDPFLSDNEIDQGLKNYQKALRRIVDACEDKNIQLIACLPTCNLRDYAPRRSHWSQSLKPSIRESLKKLFKRGEDAIELKEFTEARDVFIECIEGDRTPALLHYRLAQCYDELQDFESAYASYVEARDRDNHPNRATGRHLAILRKELEGNGILADVDAPFRRVAKDEIPGFDLFVDHVHPELDRQYLMADAILRSMARATILASEDSWHFDSEPTVEEYRNRLGFDLTSVATTFSEKAFGNLFFLLDKEGVLDPAKSALRVFEFALKYDPENPSAHLGMAVVSILKGDESSVAIDHLRRTRAKDPKVLQDFLRMTRQASKRPDLIELGRHTEALLGKL